jgi:hypothetical protein
MTYTKAQLEAMQAAGVPVQWAHDGRSWHECAHWFFNDSEPASQFRPRPGYTFNGDTAKRLVAAGVECEWFGEEENEWFPARAGTNSFRNVWTESRKPITYRIIDTDTAETPTDEIRRLRRQNDALTDVLNGIEKEHDALRNSYDVLAKEHDDIAKERDVALAKLNALRAALKGLLD